MRGPRELPSADPPQVQSGEASSGEVGMGVPAPPTHPLPGQHYRSQPAESIQSCVPAHCSISPACLPGLKSSISSENICGSPSALAGRGLGSEPGNPEWLMLLSTGHDQCQVHSLYILPHLCLTTPSKVGFLKNKPRSHC